MDITALNKANIDNLTGLWKKMGLRTDSCPRVDGLNASRTWPNRYWFDWDADLKQVLAVVEYLKQFPDQSIVPVWDRSSEKGFLLEQILIEHGFTVILEQLAMYLNLENHQATRLSPLDIKQVHSTPDIETWTKLASESFGYTMDLSSVLAVAGDPEVQLLLVFCQGEATATAMLHKTAEIIGVHSVGVPERFRGRGIANALMRQVIETSHAWGGQYITLQSSAAAESIYRRLGFKEQFAIRSYQRGKDRTANKRKG